MNVNWCLSLLRDVKSNLFLKPYVAHRDMRNHVWEERSRKRLKAFGGMLNGN